MISSPVAVPLVMMTVITSSVNDGLEMFSVNVTDSWFSLISNDCSLKHMNAKYTNKNNNNNNK